MLDRIVGAGNSSVVVSADVAQGVSERTSESYGVPEGAPALTEQTDTESYTGEQQGAAGVLGPDNIAVPQAEGTAGDGAYTNESSSRTNAVDRTVETVTTPAGGVERQTVSVALNQAALGGADVANIEQLVAAAAGIDAARGDAVAVQVVDFDTTAAEGAEAALAEARAAEQEGQMQSLIQTGAIALAVLIGSIVLAIIIARAARKPQREPVDIGELQEQRGAVDNAAWDELIAGPAEPATVPITQLLPAEPTSSEVKRAELNALAQRDPAKTADLLRAMMDDGSRA
ncbi:MAG: flagellar M-ring protein FliF C-terminal domain-containing protein [Microbacteriaceae bacterium]